MTLCSALPLLLCSPVVVQEGAEAILRANSMPLTVDAEGWSGPGAEFLVEAAAASLVVAIGEQHGNRETPLLTRHWLSASRSAGYGVLAVEVGPHTGTRLQELADRDAGVAPIREVLETYPFTFPFFNWVEEAELLLAARAEGYAVWGLDQEFIASARMHLDRLLELADEDGAVARIQEFQERAWTGFEAFVEDGDSSGGFLSTVTPTELDELAAFFPDPSSEGARLVEELRESAVVYQLFPVDNYESNRRRILLMKKHLAQRVGELGRGERMFLKFGNVHMGRGYSPLNQLDLGNQVAELAVLRGGESFHVTVVGLSRMEADGSLTDYRAQAPSLASFGSPDDPTWTVVDLRPLRPLLHGRNGGDVDPTLAQTAWRFDAAVVVPRLTVARELAD